VGDQKDYLAAIIGNPEYEKPCWQVFMCGTPFGTNAGVGPWATNTKEQNIARAKELLKEGGYKGERVVVLDPADTNIAHAQAVVTAQKLREIGMNVDLQTIDWGPRARGELKDPVDKNPRGWNIFHTWGGGVALGNPLTNPPFVTGCDGKNWFGWPCDEELEKLRLEFPLAQGLAQQKALVERMHKRFYEVVPYVPVGQFYAPIAYRNNLSGILGTVRLVLWNIERSKRLRRPARRRSPRPARSPVSVYLVRRLLATIPVMGVVALFVFGLLHLTPGTPPPSSRGLRHRRGHRPHPHPARPRPPAPRAVRRLAGADPPGRPRTSIFPAAGGRADRAAARADDRPVGHHAPGDRPRHPHRRAGGVAAGTRLDRLVMGFAVFGFSVPVFVLGYLLTLPLAIQLGWLPVQGYVSLDRGLWPCLRSVLLPSFALGTVYMALIARITRASVLEVLSEDYIRTAQAKGLPPRAVLLGHALKNASVPIVTIIGIGLTLLIGGVVITESVFALPGVGRLTVDAILRRDYPIIQGVILIFSGVYVLVNLLIDISYTFLDPRIRY
jgi:ABC-type dipeptide/oligopeptide/nickel transport system permease component